MAKVILKAQDLDGYLTPGDKKTIGDMNSRFGKSLELFKALADHTRVREHEKATEEIITLSNEMGHEMREIVRREPRVHVYSFETPREVHGEVSRLIAKLRDARTEHPEFV